jgi:hypothetical protein
MVQIKTSIKILMVYICLYTLFSYFHIAKTFLSALCNEKICLQASKSKVIVSHHSLFGLAYLHQTKVARVRFRSSSGTFPPNLNLNLNHTSSVSPVQVQTGSEPLSAQKKEIMHFIVQHISSMPNFAHAMPLAVSDLMWKAAITSHPG